MAGDGDGDKGWELRGAAGDGNGDKGLIAERDNVLHCSAVKNG